MAFSNLFTTLPAAVENAISSSEPVPCRKLRKQISEPQQAGHTRKRTTWQTEVNQAKRIKTHLNKSPTSNKDCDKPAEDHMVRSQDGQTSGHFTKELELHAHSSNGYRNNIDHNVNNCKTVNNQNGKPQPQQKKKKKKKKKRDNRQGPSNSEFIALRDVRHHPKHTRDSSIIGRRYSSNRGGKQHHPVEHKRNMSQEFKDQNALEMDGRLLCIHFLRGRCIKGEECQLEHIQVTNNTIKEVCKFYIQGFCTKGESCPYMHNSFPCKYFHTKGQCSQGDECRFSHDALTDLTKALLDNALKRDKDLSEMTKKAQCDQSVDKGEPLITDNLIPNILLHPIRPNFYNSSLSSEHCVETVTFHCQDVGLDSTTENATPPKVTDMQPTSYSSSQGCVDDPSSMEKQVQAPYSVDAVLGSIREVKNPTCREAKWPMFRDSPTPDYAPTSYTPVFEKVPDLSPSKSAKQKSNVSFLENKIRQSYKSKFDGDILLMENDSFNRFKVDLLHPISMVKTRPQKTGTEKKGDPVVQASSHGHKKANRHLARDIQDSHDSLLDTLNRNYAVMDYEHCQIKVDSHSLVGTAKPAQGAFHSLFSNPLTQNLSHPCKQSSTISHIQKPKPEVKHNIKTPSGPKNRTEPLGDTQTTTHYGSKMAFCVESADACSNAVKIPFHRLFASPITENPVQTAQSSLRSPQQSVRTHSTPCSTDQSIKVTPAKPSSEPCKATKKHIFASSSVDTVSSMLSSQMKTDDTSAYPQVRESADYTCVTPSTGNYTGLGSSKIQAEQSLPRVSSHIVATSANSVLKTLFQCLSPYCENQQDNIESSVSLEWENEDKKSSVMQQLKREEREEEMMLRDKSLGMPLHPNHHLQAKGLHKLSNEMPAKPQHPTECQASPQTFHSCQERTGRCISTSVGQAQVRTPGIHSLPIKPMMSMTQNSRSKQKQFFNRRVGGTSLKNMFKVLDPAASPFGQ